MPNYILLCYKELTFPEGEVAMQLGAGTLNNAEGGSAFRVREMFSRARLRPSRVAHCAGRIVGAW